MEKIIFLYIDIIFIVNFVMDYILLFCTAKCFKRKCSHLRILISALLGGLSACFFLINFLPKWVEMIVGYGIVIVLQLQISFGFSKIREFIKGYMVLCGVTFLWGGIFAWAYENLEWVNQYGYKMITLMAFLICTYGFSMRLFYLIKESMHHQTIYLPVKILIGEKQIDCKGLLDTGNSLKDPISGKPVMILEKQTLEKNEVKIPPEKFRMIPFHSLGTKNGILEGFTADKVVIGETGEEREVQKTVVGIYEGELSKGKEYQAILNPML